MAVIEWEPTCRPLVVKVAVELVVPRMRVEVPSTFVPSLKVAVPLGMPLPGARALMVAVKVTGSPSRAGLEEEATVLVVLAWPTVWVMVTGGRRDPWSKEPWHAATYAWTRRATRAK